jgi:hypothetical protein
MKSMAYKVQCFCTLHVQKATKTMAYLGGGAFLSTKEPPWAAPEAVFESAETEKKHPPKCEVKNKQRPRSGSSWETGREDDHNS